MNVSVTFGNLGTAPATGVTYSLALPPGLTGVSCVGATCSYDSNTGSVTVTAGANAGNDSNPNNNSASGRTVIIGAPVDIPALTPTALLALLALLLLAGWRTIDQTARRRTRG